MVARQIDIATLTSTFQVCMHETEFADIGFLAVSEGVKLYFPLANYVLFT